MGSEMCIRDSNDPEMGPWCNKCEENIVQNKSVHFFPGVKKFSLSFLLKDCKRITYPREQVEKSV